MPRKGLDEPGNFNRTCGFMGLCRQRHKPGHPAGEIERRLVANEMQEWLDSELQCEACGLNLPGARRSLRAKRQALQQ